MSVAGKKVPLSFKKVQTIFLKQINRIQQETGCRVQIVPQPNGTPERPCTLIGNPHQVTLAKCKLNEIIVRGGPRENSQYGNGDGNQIQSPYNNDYQVRI